MEFERPCGLPRPSSSPGSGGAIDTYPIGYYGAIRALPSPPGTGRIKSPGRRGWYSTQTSGATLKRNILLALSAILLVAVSASTALAGSSGSVYGGQGGSVQTDIDGGSTLPFTGLDLGLLAGGAVLLLALGFGLRRFARDRA